LGWISKDNKFIDVNSHLELLRKLYPDEPSTENHTDVVDTIGTDEEIDNLYRQAFKDGWVRIDYHNYQIGPTLSIEGLNKDRLIDIIQNIYYPYIKNGGRIFADFNNNWKKFTLPEDKDKLMQFMFGNGYEENLNENIIKEDTTTDLKSLPNREHTGWILPDNTFVSVKNHLDYLKKIYPEEFSKKIGEKNNAYIKAYEAGFVRLWFEIHNSGPELAIDGINKNRIIEILENIYYPYFNGKSGKIYVDITDIKDNNYHNHKSYRFGLPEDKDRLMQFMFGNGNEPDNDSYLEENESIDEEIEKEYGDSMAKFVANKLNLGTVEHLGGACFGQAYDVGDNKVLKITSDKSEAYNNMKLIGKDLKYIAEPYNVFELAPKLHSISRRSWVIILEKLTTDADYFYGMFDRMKDYSKKLTNYDVSYPPRSYYNSSDVYNNEYRSKIESYLVDYPDDANFYYNIMAIADELKKYGINSEDFCNSGNLGFKGDNIAYFDLGCGSGNNPDLDKELKSKSIPIDENNINEAFENLKNLPGKPTRGWILPDNKFEELNLHLSYLVKQYPELSNDWDALYNQAYSDGLIRIDFTTDSHGKYSLNIDGWNLERIKDIIENIYYPYLSNISADIFVDTANYSYTFNLPKDKMKLNFFLFGGEFEDDEYLGENKKNIVNKKKNINFADSNQSSDILSESTNTDAFVNNIKQKSFIQAIFSMGGDCYLIGGVPRDLVLGKPNKDIDLIVSKINFEKLMQLLRRFGSADMVGKSFGVIKFRDNSDGEEYDIALPREDTKNNIGGHKGFDVKYDENLPIEKDLTRRDCRFNAMAINLKSDEFIDPLGGMEDIKNKTITMVSPEAFAEDPLRLLRLIQFAARFDFTIEPNTLNTIKENAERIKEITPDRILEELNKIVNKNGNKQYGVELLVETGLFKNIFGKDIEPSRIERRDFDHVKTLAEYIFLMSYGVVDNCAEFFKNSLTGDNDSYNMIRALEIAFNADLSNQAMTNVEARSIAHNMYLVSPESLKSEILPETIENACKELLSGKYPKLVTELTINGNDLMAIGLKGKAIGDMLKSLLIKIYADKLHNNKEELLSAVKEKPINNEGVADVYAEKQFGIPNPNTEFEKNYQDLQKIQKQKNIEKPFGYVDDDVPVYKNPKSLENFSDDNVRAIGDKNGNLYVAVLDGNFVHGKMGYEAGIVSSSMSVYDLNYFVGLHRIGDSNDFGLSDSTESEFHGSDGQINRKKVIDMLHKIKQKNPQYNFYLEYYGDGTLCDDNKVNENNIK
jgi:tRNA nucleotidyltransferase/poly(A) polymerase